MSYPPEPPPEGSPEWQGQQPPEWQGQPPQGWQTPPPAQAPGWQGAAAAGSAGPASRPAGRPSSPATRRPSASRTTTLVWAILVTVMCCLPFGIISIVNSNKVSSLWAQGQYAEAQAAADSAKKWAIIGAIVGPYLSIGVLIVIYIVFIAAVVVNDIHNLPTTTTTIPGF